jgi:hypothetical protein
MGVVLVRLALYVDLQVIVDSAADIPYKARKMASIP